MKMYIDRQTDRHKQLS